MSKTILTCLPLIRTTLWKRPLPIAKITSSSLRAWTSLKLVPSLPSPHAALRWPILPHRWHFWLRKRQFAFKWPFLAQQSQHRDLSTLLYLGVVGLWERDLGCLFLLGYLLSTQIVDDMLSPCITLLRRLNCLVGSCDIGGPLQSEGLQLLCQHFSYGVFAGQAKN